MTICLFVPHDTVARHHRYGVAGIANDGEVESVGAGAAMQVEIFWAKDSCAAGVVVVVAMTFVASGRPTIHIASRDLIHRAAIAPYGQVQSIDTGAAVSVIVGIEYCIVAGCVFNLMPCVDVASLLGIANAAVAVDCQVQSIDTWAAVGSIVVIEDCVVAGGVGLAVASPQECVAGGVGIGGVAVVLDGKMQSIDTGAAVDGSVVIENCIVAGGILDLMPCVGVAGDVGITRVAVGSDGEAQGVVGGIGAILVNLVGGTDVDVALDIGIACAVAVVACCSP